MPIKAQLKTSTNTSGRTRFRLQLSHSFWSNKSKRTLSKPVRRLKGLLGRTGALFIAPEISRGTSKISPLSSLTSVYYLYKYIYLHRTLHGHSFAFKSNTNWSNIWKYLDMLDKHLLIKFFSICMYVRLNQISTTATTFPFRKENKKWKS